MRPRKALRGLARPLRSMYDLSRHHVARAKMEALYRKSKRARPGERVLFWIPGGMPGMLHVEGVLASALRLRGVEVHAVLCDGPFVACVRRQLADQIPLERWQDACAACRASTSRVLDMFGIPYSYIGDFVPPETRSVLREKASHVTWDNLDTLEVGSTVRSSVVRFLKGARLAGHEEIVPEYAYSALLCASAAETAISQLAPSRVFMSHGVYVDWGPALSAAFRHGLPVSGWMASYLDDHFYFRHVEDPQRIDFHNMSGEAWREESSAPFKTAQEAALAEYLTNRYHRKVSFDMKHLPEVSGDTRQFRDRYVSMPDRPVWGIMAHINWDSAAEYAPMGHDSFDEWVLDTVERVSSIRDVNWLLKIHPSEAWDNPERGVQRLVEEHFPSLPSHVRLVPAEERVSPLDFYRLIDGGVTVYGTSGLEIALLGKPVILAGEAHYAGKGFTHDGPTKESYRALLARASELGPLTREQRLLAKKYAYAYFIRRQVPLPALHDPNGYWKFQLAEREAMLPGNNEFVDFVCRRLLDGQDFLMDDALVEAAHPLSTVRDTPEELLIAIA